jgi:dTDP-4-amino-4,6-dideoxygalactose transaminase
VPEKNPAWIPVMQPKVIDPGMSLERLRAVAKSGVFSNFGPQVRELEQRFAEIFGVPSTQVVTAANATLALTGAMSVSEASSWNIPAWTFAATAHAATMTGMPFRFVDVSPETWMIDTSAAGQAGEGTVVVMPFGTPLAEANWGDDAEVVVDAAASFGSMVDKFPTLPLRTALVFSLHATKVLGVGEGAVIVFGDADRATAFRSWSNFGFAGSRDSVSSGTNAKMSEYVAALLHTELDHWPQTLSEWTNVRTLVDAASGRTGLKLQPHSRGVIGPYWIAVFEDIEARRTAEYLLAEAGVETRRWWGPGLHRMSAFAGVPFTDLRQTESLGARYLGLPFYRGLETEQIAKIVNILEQLLTRFPSKTHASTDNSQNASAPNQLRPQSQTGSHRD